MLEEELRAAETEGTRAEVVRSLEKDLIKLYKDPNLTIKPPQLEKRGGAYYSDAACSLISSIYNDKRDIQTVNTLNNGAIASITDDSAVEVNCVITKDGPKPISVGNLPVTNLDIPFTFGKFIFRNLINLCIGYTNVWI